MHIQKVQVRNFRLLCDVELALEPETTVIVGRNNSGKTSFAEIIRRFLWDSSPTFQIEDFSSASYDGFCSAHRAYLDGSDESEVRDIIPNIELRIFFKYDPATADLGPLSEIVIDLDPTCSQALAVVRYELQGGKIAALFEGHKEQELKGEARNAFFRSLRERIPVLYTTKIWAEDPNDSSNQKTITQPILKSLLRSGFVNAQRGLDDVTSKESDVLGKILENLFTTATSPTAGPKDQLIAKALQEAVQSIQEQINNDFNQGLKTLVPTFADFGYPGLDGPEITTETILDVKKLLSNHTKVRYSGYSEIPLPESYNGLGARNLIFILLQLVGFYKSFRAELTTPAVHLIFIEEPEAHLHPQMQEVFIRQLTKLAAQLNAQHADLPPWPVQFVVSTHSSHIANEAGFETIRYFMATPNEQPIGVRHTKIKDLREGLQGTEEDNRQFLHQYLTLTRCDLFFADKAILVEGLSERLLLPCAIRKLETSDPHFPKISSQYITIMEVGGAYAHLFFDLLEFLELKFLVITDLDSVKANGSGRNVACPVHLGESTSNACLRAWFDGEGVTPSELLAKTNPEKVQGNRRLAYQVPEVPGGPCGRTFEDAFILANKDSFGLTAVDSTALELEARQLAEGLKKSEFALKYAISETEWTAPSYITEGIRWLAQGGPPITDPKLAMIAEAVANDVAAEDAAA